MILGVDVSAHIETLAAGGRYFVGGKEVEPLSYLHDHNGISVLRLRLWKDPYDKEGHPYGGGTSDMKKFLELAKLGLSKGYQILLDYHFSDFWCDPAKQKMPKQWQGYSYEETCRALEDYIEETLSLIKREGIPLYGVQIGNEITNGMLWPIGMVYHGEKDPEKNGYKNLCGLLSIASKGVRKHYPDAKIVIHLERSFDQEIYKEFFDHIQEAGIDYDVIGMSYYPYWHGSFDMLFANVDLMKSLYHKPIWIVETSYGFTVEAAYVDKEAWNPLVNTDNLIAQKARQPYPLTQDGQAEFLKNLLRLSEEHGVEAIYYWEPLWLPIKELTWATIEGQDYINEHRCPYNEWANQCLFDYKGEATKGLFVYSVK